MTEVLFWGEIPKSKLKLRCKVYNYVNVSPRNRIFLYKQHYYDELHPI